jgi:hypothetical protein
VCPNQTRSSMCKNPTAVLLLALALAGCATTERRGPAGSSRFSVSKAPESASSPSVPSGTEFMAVVERSISSETSRPGADVELRTLGPLHSSDARVVLPSGTRIHGRITGVTSGYLPTIRLLFTSADTPYGTVPIHAVIRYAGESAWVDPHGIYDPDVLGYDTILYGSQFRPNLAQGTAVGGGPRSLDEPAQPIRLPAGSEIDLVLSRALTLARPPRQ